MHGPMSDTSARRSTWRDGYEAALHELERLAERLHAEGASGSDYRHASQSAEGVEYALKHLRAQLAGRPSEPAGREGGSVPDAVADREWTEG